MKYTVDQEDAYMNVAIDVNLPRKKNIFRVINGYAGTGKTTMLPYMAKDFRDKFSEILVTAPTNKAVSVILEKFKKSGIDIAQFSTLHSYIYGSPNKYGYFVPKDEQSSNIMIMVDESSMITKDVLNDLLKRAVNSYFLFIGDSFQLEPVGDDPGLFGNLYPTSRLSDVVRHDNGILESATRLRSSKYADLYLNDNVFRVTESKLIDYYLSDFEKDKDVVYICSTNRKRVYMNNLFRDQLDLSGEITTEPLICINNNNHYSNGELFRMVDPVIKGEVDVTLPGIDGRVKGAIYEDLERTILFVENYEKPSLYTQQFNKLPYPEKAGIFGHKNIEDGYLVSRDVIICTLGFAISAHKSQGSQFENVFIDFDYCSPKWDPRRWLYTAVTRATNEVNVVGSNNFKFV